MPSQYKITYFDLRARAETMRTMLHYVGQEFEDRRIDRQTEWPGIKDSTPFGQLPLLEVDGRVICQSNAGGRYIAKQFNLYGSNTWEEAQIDMVVDCVEDMIRPWKAIYFEEDPNTKADLKKKYEDEELPKTLAAFERLLNKREYFVGNKVSFADFHFVNYFTTAIGLFEIQKDLCPGLFALKDRVESLPNVKEWIAKRPNTEI